MTVVDSDAHVVETERTWDFIPASDQALRPEIVMRPNDAGEPAPFWVIDGKVRGGVRQPVGKREEWDPNRISEDMLRQQASSGRNMATPDASKHMENVGARLQHMDELGIDIQMLYPTIFLRRLTDKPETRVAISQGYNRWLADIWQKSDGRLTWAAVLPLSEMDESLKELEWAAQHGACGVFMRGVEEEGVLYDPYFFPLYDRMNQLNMAVTVHIGNGQPEMEALLGRGKGGSPFSSMRVFSVAACHSWILAGIPQEFPNLRIGFVEAAAQWIPYMDNDLRRRFPGRFGRPAPENILKENRVWVTCQTDDDIPYILRFAGEDNLLIGTDYGHTDQSSEIEALRIFRERGTVEPRLVDKILGENPKLLYSIKEPQPA
jgi:predicted TIM-barrel fold metal-dependent hydrolase